MSIFRRKARHRHEWHVVGYGGCGWFLLRCLCGATEIDGLL